MRDEVVIEVSTMGELNQALSRAYKSASRGIERGPVQIALRHKKSNRTTRQNSLLWAILCDVAKQVDWYGQRLTSEEWKDVFTVSLKRQKTIPGIDGGFIMVGGRTSKMSKQEFSDLVDLIHAFGIDHDVTWSERALKQYDDYKEANSEKIRHPAQDATQGQEAPFCTQADEETAQKGSVSEAERLPLA